MHTLVHTSHALLDLSPSLSHAGKFEDFKVLGALLELDIGGCQNIDCKNALEVLPTMPWAGQIQKLRLACTDAEGTTGTFFSRIADQSAFPVEFSILWSD